MKEKLIILIFSLFASSSLYAQFGVSGKIKDEQGEVIPFTNVLEKGTLNGVVAGADGDYTISVKNADAVLVVSSIGFQKSEVAIGNRTQIDFVLKTDNISLDQAVVVGYGTQKKKLVSGSVSSLKADETRDKPVSTFGQAIQGKMSGVQVIQSSGKPGEGISFRIRGAGSLSTATSNAPLFVVDGMPMNGETSNISPDEIESYSVLKDASTAALYGSRAANGVILITTKKAKGGKTTVDFTSNAGIQMIDHSRRPDMMNAREYATWKKNHYEDMIKYTDWKNPITGKAEVYDEYKNPEQYSEGTDWFDKITRNALIQNYSLTISSGTDKLKSTVVAAYTNQEGMLLNTGYERMNLRANTEYTFNKNIKAGVNIAPSFRNHKNQETDGNWNTLAAAIYAPPIISFVSTNGSHPVNLQTPGSLPQPNPYLMLTRQKNSYKGYRILTNAFIEFNFLNMFTWKSTINIDNEANSHHVYKPVEAVGGINTVGTKSEATYATGFNTSWLTEHTLVFEKSWGKHNLDVLGGFTAEKTRWEGSGIYGEDLAEDYPWLNQAKTTKILGKNTPEAYSLASFIARLNYNYNEKYILQLSMRRDGCSRFGADNRWGSFPSVSGGWIVTEEDFMQEIKPVLNYAKIRTGYGLLGNNNIGNYNHLADVEPSNTIFNNQIENGSYVGTIENRKLTWEKTSQLSIGLDLGFFNDRIYIQSDYWRKETKVMLFNLNLPNSSGFSTMMVNDAHLNIWGYDFDIETRNLVGDFKWTTKFNASFSRNKVISLPDNVAFLGTNEDYSGGWNRTETGKPAGYLHGYIYDGVFMNQAELDKGPKYADSDEARASMVGSPRMKDVSGPEGKPDGIITKDDRTMIGNPNPDCLLGMTNNFEYKNFDLSILLTSSIGGDIALKSMEYSYNLDGAFNMDKALLNTWHSEENPGNGTIARSAGPGGTTWLSRDRSSLFVFDGTYVALKNITLGYNTTKIPYIKRARIYASLQNVLYITNYPGMNPEANRNGNSLRFAGIDDNAYPIARVLSLGLNISF